MNQEQDVPSTSIEFILSLVKSNIAIQGNPADIRFQVALTINQMSQCTQNTLTKTRITKHEKTKTHDSKTT